MKESSSTKKISFESDQYMQTLQSRRYKQNTNPSMVRFLIKYSGGLIRNKKQANYFLLFFAVLGILITFFIVFGDGGEATQRQEEYAPATEYGGRDFPDNYR